MGEFTGQAVYRMWFDDSIKAPIPQEAGHVAQVPGPYGPPDGPNAHIKFYGHGFDPNMPVPVFKYNAGTQRPPKNCGMGLWGTTWRVSPQVKAVFERIDPRAVTFHPAKLRAVHKREVVSETAAFVMDIVRFCAGLPPGQDVYACQPHGQFDGGAIGDARVFRLTHSPFDEMCTQEAFEALQASGVELRFQLAGKIHG